MFVRGISNTIYMYVKDELGKWSDLRKNQSDPIIDTGKLQTLA